MNISFMLICLIILASNLTIFFHSDDNFVLSIVTTIETFVLLTLISTIL